MTDFTITITDQDLLNAITWKRNKDNTYEGRAADSKIATDAEWLQIEAIALLRGLVDTAKAGMLADAIEAAKSGDATALIALAPKLTEAA